MHRLSMSLCVLTFLAGCASKPCHERGWIGGTTKPVERTAFLRCAPCYTSADVIGMPAGVPEQSGLLVTDVPGGSPLAQAGLSRGDLILGVDGVPVAEPVAFRECVESRVPGDTTTLDVWRQGQRLQVPVVVGRERYKRAGTVAFYLLTWPSSELDLWPLDDGINVLGLVTAKTTCERHDLETTERAYLRAAVPCKSPPALQQERVRVAVLPFMVGTHVEVLSQEPVAPR